MIYDAHNQASYKLYIYITLFVVVLVGPFSSGVSSLGLIVSLAPDNASYPVVMFKTNLIIILI